MWQNARAANRLQPTTSTAQLSVSLDFLFLASVKNQKQTISDLVHAAKQKDQHAFRQLLDLHWNELYGFMIKRTENENELKTSVFRPFQKRLIKSKPIMKSLPFQHGLPQSLKTCMSI